MATPLPKVTARLLVESFPNIGAQASVTVDSEVILPIVLLGGSGTSSTWNVIRSETRKIAASDTGIVFEMPGDAVLVALAADGPFVLRLGAGETELLLQDLLIGGSGAPLKTGDLAFEVDGNGDTPVNLTVLLLGKT
jgi:hypothetical protein